MGHCIATKMLAQFAAIRIFTGLIGGAMASLSGFAIIVVCSAVSFIATSSFLILLALLLGIIIAAGWLLEVCFSNGGKYLLKGLKVLDDIL